ncbi:MAG: methyltransferase [Rhodobacteraceae bacterium]|nr:MAG: methyltransferase [Paracoccaceae bacterium]
MNIKDIVLQGYTDRVTSPDGAMGLEAAQVCRMDAYDPALLRQVPKDIIDRDYGCGNPSKYAQAGDVALDLGSGSGKICYILAQIVGPQGHVIGVDMNKDMLALSRSHQKPFGDQLGYSNLRFFWGTIDDLATDLEASEETVSGRSLENLDDYTALQDSLKDQRESNPMIADNSVDLVVSNCVINLVDTDRKLNVLQEIFRVLRPGGRIALSDNVSNIDVPEELKNDPELWVGCYSGVYQEQEFYRVLCDVGFAGLTVKERAGVPEKTIGAVEFQSVTVTAFKPLEAVTSSDMTRVLYKGPWTFVSDDEGNQLHRGKITLVDKTTARQLRHSAFSEHLFFLDDQPGSNGSGCCG